MGWEATAGPAKWDDRSGGLFLLEREVSWEWTRSPNGIETIENLGNPGLLM
jgi:hypothetical protein